jgi:small subunit ribosomal protein S1
MPLTRNQSKTALKTSGSHAGSPDSEFGRLLQERPDAIRVVRPGEVVKGTILDIASNTLYIDLGPLGVGIVFGRELLDAQETFRHARVGDTVEAVVLEGENDEGYAELSLRSASEERAWNDLREKEKTGEIFPVQILEANKGGLILRVTGVTGFLPVSQLSAEHYPRVEGGDKQKILERLKQYIGHAFNVRVITTDRREGKLIVSEKAAMPPETQTALEKLTEGTIVEGRVSGVVEFGVFVKFTWEGIELEGLAHISELAWQRIDNPSDFAKVGQPAKAMVIGVDGARISLSMKRMREDPWLTVEKKYHVGEQIEGEVLKVTPFGAFVKLDDDIHGLVHVSELTDDETLKPEEIVKPGEQRTFRIISIEPVEHRLGLSLKAESKSKKPKAKKHRKSEAKA